MQSSDTHNATVEIHATAHHIAPGSTASADSAAPASPPSHTPDPADSLNGTSASHGSDAPTSASASASSTDSDPLPSAASASSPSQPPSIDLSYQPLLSTSAGLSSATTTATTKKVTSFNLNKAFKPTQQKQVTGVVVLGRGRGKVVTKPSAPRPVNLPSLKKENKGFDPTVAIVQPGGGGWKTEHTQPQHVASAGAAAGSPTGNSTANSTNSSPSSSALSANSNSLYGLSASPPTRSSPPPTAAYVASGRSGRSGLGLSSQDEFPSLHDSAGPSPAAAVAPPATASSPRPTQRADTDDDRRYRDGRGYDDRRDREREYGEREREADRGRERSRDRDEEPSRQPGQSRLASTDGGRDSIGAANALRRGSSAFSSHSSAWASDDEEDMDYSQPVVFADGTTAPARDRTRRDREGEVSRERREPPRERDSDRYREDGRRSGGSSRDMEYRGGGGGERREAWSDRRRDERYDRERDRDRPPHDNDRYGSRDGRYEDRTERRLSDNGPVDDTEQAEFMKARAAQRRVEREEEERRTHNEQEQRAKKRLEEIERRIQEKRQRETEQAPEYRGEYRRDLPDDREYREREERERGRGGDRDRERDRGERYERRDSDRDRRRDEYEDEKRHRERQTQRGSHGLDRYDYTQQPPPSHPPQAHTIRHIDPVDTHHVEPQRVTVMQRPKDQPSHDLAVSLQSLSLIGQQQQQGQSGDILRVQKPMQIQLKLAEGKEGEGADKASGGQARPTPPPSIPKANKVWKDVPQSPEAHPSNSVAPTLPHSAASPPTTAAPLHTVRTLWEPTPTKSQPGKQQQGDKNRVREVPQGQSGVPLIAPKGMSTAAAVGHSSSQAGKAGSSRQSGYTGQRIWQEDVEADKGTIEKSAPMSSSGIPLIAPGLPMPVLHTAEKVDRAQRAAEEKEARKDVLSQPPRQQQTHQPIAPVASTSPALPAQPVSSHLPIGGPASSGLGPVLSTSPVDTAVPASASSSRAIAPPADTMQPGLSYLTAGLSAASRPTAIGPSSLHASSVPFDANSQRAASRDEDLLRRAPGRELNQSPAPPGPPVAAASHIAPAAAATAQAPIGPGGQQLVPIPMQIQLLMQAHNVPLTSQFITVQQLGQLQALAAKLQTQLSPSSAAGQQQQQGGQAQPSSISPPPASFNSGVRPSSAETSGPLSPTGSVGSASSGSSAPAAAAASAPSVAYNSAMQALAPQLQQLQMYQSQLSSITPQQLQQLNPQQLAMLHQMHAQYKQLEQQVAAQVQHIQQQERQRQAAMQQQQLQLQQQLQQQQTEQRSVPQPPQPSQPAPSHVDQSMQEASAVSAAALGRPAAPSAQTTRQDKPVALAADAAAAPQRSPSPAVPSAAKPTSAVSLPAAQSATGKPATAASAVVLANRTVMSATGDVSSRPPLIAPQSTLPVASSSAAAAAPAPAQPSGRGRERRGGGQSSPAAAATTAAQPSSAAPSRKLHIAPSAPLPSAAMAAGGEILRITNPHLTAQQQPTGTQQRTAAPATSAPPAINIITPITPITPVTQTGAAVAAVPAGAAEKTVRGRGERSERGERRGRRKAGGGKDKEQDSKDRPADALLADKSATESEAAATIGGEESKADAEKASAAGDAPQQPAKRGRNRRGGGRGQKPQTQAELAALGDTAPTPAPAAPSPTTAAAAALPSPSTVTVGLSAAGETAASPAGSRARGARGGGRSQYRVKVKEERKTADGQPAAASSPVAAVERKEG